MIYIDTSVALAYIMSEQRRPPAAFWPEGEVMSSSQLLRYEIWNRLHAYGASSYRRDRAREVLRRVDLCDMSDRVVQRALSPFPAPVRTLDGLHLATMHHLEGQGALIELASYDARLLAAARSMGFVTLEP